jgi:PAS domain S-box-containing protein
MPDELKKMYFSEPVMLDKKVKEYILRAKSFLETRDGRSLTYLLSNSQLLLKDLDSAVSIYQKNTEFKTKKLKTNELFIVSFIMLTLLFEALFIFRPANESVKRKTKELKEQKEYADIITQINTNAIIALDESFKILTFNHSAEKIFGYTEAEMIGTKLIDDRIIPLKHLKDHNMGLTNFMKNRRFKNPDEVFELNGKHKDGTIFPIRISFGAKIEKDNIIVVGNIQNITKEKEKDKLILQQSRFAAMGEMIENIAHQWRQPLSSISAIATGTKLRYKNNLISDEELDETFVKIKDHTTHLSKTIDDFRDFLKEDKQKEVFSLKSVISKSIVLMEASFMDNKIKLFQNGNDEDIMLNGSSSELSQVFLNILSNAKDILLEKDIKKKIVVIQTVKQDDYVIVKIKDNAGGIPEDIIDNIFDPYFTTKHKSQGTGIGLFMSNKIISKNYNGQIEALNREFEQDDEKYFGAEFNVKIKFT